MHHCFHVISKARSFGFLTCKRTWTPRPSQRPTCRDDTAVQLLVVGNFGHHGNDNDSVVSEGIWSIVSKPTSILFQKMLDKFEIGLESNVSKHLEMKNAGWMGWAASFCGPASIGCAEMLAGLIFLAGLTNQPAFCFKKCWLNSKSCWNLASASI